MDKCTFGNSQAAITLVAILGEPDREQYARKASRIIDKFFKSLIALEPIPDRAIRETAYKLWRNRFLERIDGTHFPAIIETLTKSVVVTQYRKALRASYK